MVIKETAAFVSSFKRKSKAEAEGPACVKALSSALWPRRDRVVNLKLTESAGPFQGATF